jgi:hypothetical protein
MPVQHSHGRRRAGAKRARALAAERIGVRRVGDQDVALRNVPIFREIEQRLDVVVVDSEAAPNDVLLVTEDVPSEAEARSEVTALAPIFRISEIRDRLRNRRRVERLVVRSDLLSHRRPRFSVSRFVTFQSS